MRRLLRVAVVYSQQTAHSMAANERAKVEDHLLGCYQALIESRFLSRWSDRLLDGSTSISSKVLILPNIAALSEMQCQRFVTTSDAEGVSSCFETRSTMNGRYDAGLRPRGDLFGTSFAGSFDARMMNSYLRLETDPTTGKRHPILAGLEDAGRIINGVSRVQTRSDRKYENPPLTLIPSYPDLPMEEVFPRVASTDIPEVYCREAGTGRVVYFPWDIDRTFWEVLAFDHLKLLRNAVDWASNEPRPLRSKVHGHRVTIWKQKDS